MGIVLLILLILLLFGGIRNDWGYGPNGLVGLLLIVLLVVLIVGHGPVVWW